MADRLIAAQWLAREAPAAALASQLSAPPAAAAQRNIRVTIGSDSFDVAIQARVERPEQSAAKRSRVLPFPAASD
ncbi:MAG: hypothetical protein MUF01_18815 [Bryobacterales bacterium]|nr:hypothetical protein [Bryobacterales bacterium]